MRSRTVLWLVPVIVYAVFAYWYTNTGGALTPAEVEVFAQRLADSGYTPAEVARVRAFMASDTGRQFVMLNNLDMNEIPGDVAGAEPGETADQLFNRYAQHMFPEMLKRASHPIYSGQVVSPVLDVVGIAGAEQWDRAVLVRYRSRRDLVEIASNPAFHGQHQFKMAALTKTIGYPMESSLYLSDPRFLLALVFILFAALSDLALFRKRRG